MEKETNKFHALQLFTDTFAAETVHLTNEQVGIYIRLLCFAWTKNCKPFSLLNAYKICGCTDPNCEKEVENVISEFFKEKISQDQTYSTFTHKRLTAEHDYLTAKYKRKSIAGKKGADARYSANGKNVAPIPIPKPIPNLNKYDSSFENLWSSLNIKRGAKFTAHKIWQKLQSEIEGIKIAEIYNKQQSGIDAKFVPHFSTWLSQHRWEIEEKDQKHSESPATLRTKMEKLGYQFRHSEDRFDYFKKDGQEYKIDTYDKEHIIHKVE